MVIRVSWTAATNIIGEPKQLSVGEAQPGSDVAFRNQGQEVPGAGWSSRRTHGRWKDVW